MKELSKQEIESIAAEQGNKLIAEFMCGWKLGQLFEWPNGGKGYANISDFKYHSSWDWLYPVYQKLFTLKFETSLKLHWGRRFGTIRRLITDGENIGKVHEKIVTAIEWYNKTSKAHE